VSNIVLLAGLVVMWGLVALLARKAVSIIPIVPLVPGVLLVLGIGLNAWKPWAGTITVGVLHLVVAALVGFGLLREKRQAPPSDGGGSAG
jgi:hypothetical protein